VDKSDTNNQINLNKINFDQRRYKYSKKGTAQKDIVSNTIIYVVRHTFLNE